MYIKSSISYFSDFKYTYDINKYIKIVFYPFPQNYLEEFKTKFHNNL